MQVWTLLVDDVVSVHRSEQDARAALRSNYADGDDNAPDEDAELVGFLVGIGFRVAIDPHDI